MKLDVYDPTVFVSSNFDYRLTSLNLSTSPRQISIHSPFELPSDNTPFFSMGTTDEIESTYNMLETM